MSRTWPLPSPRGDASTAIVYLVRGRDSGYAEAASRFLNSYRAHPAGAAHELVLLSKGFDDGDLQSAVVRHFEGVAAQVLTVPDDSFDIGAYREAARLLHHDRVAFLNGWSEVLADDWLLKLLLNLEQPGIGMVGCTGTYESMRLDRRFAPFPNPHLRSNAFLMERGLFLDALGDRPIREKLDAFLAESGPDSITRHVLGRGLGVLLVGRDGRGYPPHLWPRSRTFRLGRGDNVLIGDNQTRVAANHAWPVLRRRQFASWGPFLSSPAPAEIGTAASAQGTPKQQAPHDP